MDIVLLIGRILFAALFLGSAVGHLTQTKSMAGYAASKRIPAPAVAVAGSGVLIMIGALSIVLGVVGDLGSLLIVAFLLPTTLLMHDFWKETDAMARTTEMIQFNKNLGLVGGALGFFWVFAHDPGLTLTSSLF